MFGLPALFQIKIKQMYNEADELIKLWLVGNKKEFFEKVSLFDKNDLCILVLLIAEKLDDSEKINFRIACRQNLENDNEATGIRSTLYRRASGFG